jgi:tRNA/tmRNA/rRNA uracil-C5-methylase (TrmA/RlmC/RlmD family)
VLGATVTVRLEKPAAGGRMIGRWQGRVVLVAGGIPGEKVLVEVDRLARDVAYGTVRTVLEPDPDRRAAVGDPACGGAAYAHIAYQRQLSIKAEVVSDAFRRIARHPLAEQVNVTASPERGYRMRARLHVEGRRLGFYREGTHQLCDAGATGQLLDSTSDALEHLAAAMEKDPAADLAAIDLAENVPAVQRVGHLCLQTAAAVHRLGHLKSVQGFTGLSYGLRESSHPVTLSGDPYVSDTLLLPGSDGQGVQLTLRRRGPAFFQSNRYLLATLAGRVNSLVPAGPVVDLYAGVGLFGLSAAAAGKVPVVLVEGNPVSVPDLRANAGVFGDAVRIEPSAVEGWLAGAGTMTDCTLIVDPPRTGMSRQAVSAAIDARARRVIYVSCDTATLARDVGRFLGAGYRLTGLEAFDLFPNSAHIESIAVLEMG